MQVAKVNGVNIDHEVIGTEGPWIALSPGGRREGEGARGLAEMYYGEFITAARAGGMATICAMPERPAETSTACCPTQSCMK